MEPWHWAMLVLLPLMLGRHRLRTWLALLAASVVTYALPYMAVDWYIVTDAAAGLIVLRRPAGCAQRAIGALFALMVLYSVGYMLADNAAGAATYLVAQTLLGWAQWGCLAAWGLYDGGKTLLDRLGFARRLPATYERV